MRAGGRELRPRDPDGHEHLEAFELTTHPRMLYTFGAVQLTREVLCVRVNRELTTSAVPENPRSNHSTRTLATRERLG